MNKGVLLFLLCLLPLPAMAANCIKLYQQGTQSHNSVVAQEQGTQQFFIELGQLEDDMFSYLQQCKNNARLFSLMAEIQITARQASLAQLYAQKALSINPDIWQSQYAMGTVLTLAREYDKALVHLQKASQLAPDRTGLKVGLCRTQTLAQKHAGAIKTCTQVINSNEKEKGKLAAAYHFRGLAHNAMGDKKQAEQDAQKARELGFNM